MAGEVAEHRQADVDEEVGAAAGDDVDAYGRDCVGLGVLVGFVIGVGVGIWAEAGALGGVALRRTENGDEHEDNGGDHLVVFDFTREAAFAVGSSFVRVGGEVV